MPIAVAMPTCREDQPHTKTIAHAFYEQNFISCKRG